MDRTSKKRVAVVGLGFVGLTTALGFSQKGCEVFGYDLDKARISEIEAGRLPFHEPGLDDALKRHLGRRFRLSPSLADAVDKSEVVFFCVGTPALPSGAVDVTFLTRAVKAALKQIVTGKFKTFIIKSTLPPGTTDRCIVPLLKSARLKPGRDIGLANNPEFLREGLAWEDFLHPDRIVIGTTDERSHAAVAELYDNFRAEIFSVSFNTAEFIKSTSNALLATLISFANEASMIADGVGGIDVKKAFQILHRDRRWSGHPAKMSSYAFPGCGFGGYCLPKDVAALREVARKSSVRAQILDSVLRTNHLIQRHFANKIIAATRPQTAIGILGLSFKAGSDDVRESQAAAIIKLLLESGRPRVHVFDPMAMDTFRKAYDYPVQFEPTIGHLVRRSKVIALVTAWPQFKQQQKLLARRRVFNGRYLLC